MGNNRSRVSPSRTVRILDSQTRARYKNQQELIELRLKLKHIRIEHNEALSRLASERHEIKTKLRDLQYENGQRELFRKLDKRDRQNSTSSINETDICDESEISTMDSSSLLLCNLNASIEWGKSIVLPCKHEKLLNKPKPLNAFETHRLQYLSKLDSRYESSAQTESLLLNDKQSLKQHSEHMQRSIQIAVARAARDSHTAARRKNHVY